VYEHLLSGVGLGAFVLYNTIPADSDPLGPENVLGFVSGLLTGTGSVITGRWTAVCKSPLTGGWGDANCGGTLAPATKQCGYDGIFFNGISPEPVYLYSGPDGTEIKPAAHLWGLDAVQAEEALWLEYPGKKKPAVAVIGGAGEKLSLIAGIVNDAGRIAARSGVGAVMGSKRLKAIVLNGAQPIVSRNPQAAKETGKALAVKVRKMNLPRWMKGSLLPIGEYFMGKMKGYAPLDGIATAGIFKRWGTIYNTTLGIPNGDSPIRNWAGSVKDFGYAKFRSLDPDRVLARERKKYFCSSCVLGCGGILDMQGIGQGEFETTHKIEYETASSFGGLILNHDLDAILYINELLNRAGMDSISAGGTVAFAIEAFERGVITPEMTGGLRLAWGDATSIVELVRRMIAREGIGDLLADGVKKAAERLGVPDAEYAVHAGGQEPGMHDPRLDPILGLHFSADPTPGRHTIGAGQYYNVMHLWEKVSWAPRGRYTDKSEEYTPTDELALKSVANACYKQLADGSGGCLFGMILGVEHWKLFDWLNDATGWNRNPDEYMWLGRRIQTLRQMFNIKHGVDPRSFRLGSRLAGEPPLKAGPLKGKTVKIDEMMSLHWKHFGWDERSGAPLPETIVALRLDSLLTPES
jgi:aldehyde:ferredoxin oxidoreductase